MVKRILVVRLLLEDVLKEQPKDLSEAINIMLPRAGYYAWKYECNKEQVIDDTYYHLKEYFSK